MKTIRRQRRTALSGVTLTEVVIAVLIVTPLMLLLLSVFFRSVRDVTEAWEETEAIAVAQRFMDRIRTARWDQTTPEGGGITLTPSPVLGLESTAFDDVDDWNGFSGADPIPEYARYNRAVVVQYVNLSGSNFNVATTTTSYKRVTIRVNRGSGKTFSMTRIFANANP